MAKQTRTTLRGRASSIANQKQAGANTAPLVGGLDVDIIDSVTLDWDPDRAYLPDETVIWQNRIVRAFQATDKGQSPATHPVKWIDSVVDSLEKLGNDGPDLPVLAKAIKQYIAARLNQGNNQPGFVPPKATLDQLNEGLDDSAYITSFLLAQFIAKLVDIIQNEGSDKNIYDLITALPPLDKAGVFLELVSVFDATGNAKLKERIALLLSLDDLLKLSTDRSLIIDDTEGNAQGNFQLITSGSGLTERGLEVFSGKVRELFVGRTADGKVGLSDKNSNSLFFQSSDLLISIARIRAGQANAQFRTLNTTTLPYGVGVGVPLGAFASPSGGFDIAGMTGAQLVDYIDLDLKNFLKANGGGGTTDPNSDPAIDRRFDKIYCHPVTAPVVVTPPFFADITPDMVNVAQPHGLGTAKLFRTLMNINDEIDTEMKLTVTSTTYMVSYASADGTGSSYEGGYIRLEKR